MKPDEAGGRALVRVFDCDTAARDAIAAYAVELDVCRQCRPNVLLIGSFVIQKQVLMPLIAWANTPFQLWPLDGSPRRVGTVLLWDAAGLDTGQQSEVLDWLKACTEPVQVITLAEQPLFPLVERGQFLPDLYYRLNTIVIDCRIRPLH